MYSLLRVSLYENVFIGFLKCPGKKEKCFDIKHDYKVSKFSVHVFCSVFSMMIDIIVLDVL